MSLFNQREWEGEMDTLSLLFSELHLIPWDDHKYNINMKKDLCVVCYNETNNIVQNICENNCKYQCHNECLNNWIIHKGYGVYCMICGLSQNHDYITGVFNKSKCFNNH